jgi:hypothetical protein
MTLAISWSSGRAQFRRECYQTDFRTTKRHLNLTRLTHRSGLSSRSTTTFRPVRISPPRASLRYRSTETSRCSWRNSDGVRSWYAIQGERASRLLETVETNLLTPVGLRSLAPKESAYVPHYEGGVAQRDDSYHLGTVWPWLIGPFVEGWLRVRGNTAEARARFFPPLREHLHKRVLTTSQRSSMPSRYIRQGAVRSRRGLWGVSPPVVVSLTEAPDRRNQLLRKV